MSVEKLTAFLTRKTVGAFCATICAVSLLVGALVGCPSPATPTQTPQQIAGESVIVLAGAWTIAADGCLAAAQAQNSDTLRQQCAAVLVPLSDLITDAAAMVDSWQDVDQANLPCVLADVANGFAPTSALLAQLGVSVPVEIAQGLTLAEAFIPQCTREAGAPDAGSALGGTPATAAQLERTLLAMRHAIHVAPTLDAGAQ